MSKYRPLQDYLSKLGLTETILSFKEIEGLVGALPPTADLPQFWANSTSPRPRPQRDACRAAGYSSFLIAGASKVRFVRIGLSPMRLEKTARPVAPPQQGKPPLTVDALLAGGFKKAHHWSAQEGRLEVDVPFASETGVYAFVRDGRALYVGIAASGFRNRLKFYAKPGISQKTSIRINLKLLKECAANARIEIYTVSPPNVSWNGWEIDAAAGLEVALIRRFDLPWNIRGT